MRKNQQFAERSRNTLTKRTQIGLFGVSFKMESQAFYQAE